MTGKAFYAAANLTFHLFLHLGRRLILRKSPGLDRFLENYREDRIVPLTKEEKSPDFSRCVSCGLCDSLCPAVKDLSQEEFLGPSFVSHVARSIPDFVLAPLDLTPCNGCRGCESICPERVPIQRIVEFMKGKTMNKRIQPL